MMGLMIIPEFQIFGELLPLNQLSGTTVGYLLVTCSGFPGRGSIIGGAMAPLYLPHCRLVKLSTSSGSCGQGYNSDLFFLFGNS